MERKLQERMIGAAVLIVALVILGPVILSGRGRQESPEMPAPAQRGGEMRSHTFSLDGNQPPVAATTVAPRAEPVAASPAPPSDVPAAPPASPSAPPVKPRSLVVAQPAVEAAGQTTKAKPAPAPLSRPVEEKAPAVTVAPAVTPKPSSGNWVVQVGTFGQKDNADRLVASLRKSGFDAFVSATERSGKPLYRVRVGPGGSRDAATALAGRLAKNGQSGQVVSQ